MSQAAPFRSRPNLHMNFTQNTGSPHRASQTSPASTQLTASSSVVSSASLHGKMDYYPLEFGSPRPYAKSTATPLYSRTTSRLPSPSRYDQYRLKQCLSHKPLWLVLAMSVFMIWLFNGGREELDVVKNGAAIMSREFLTRRQMEAYRFIPASNPKIHYMGRWTSMPNRLRMDGLFSGAYFDLKMKNTTSLFLMLHNENHEGMVTLSDRSMGTQTVAQSPDHLSFQPFIQNRNPAAPVSLLARIDDQEYIFLPDSQGIVAVCVGSLSTKSDHDVRIIAPMINNGAPNTVELEGLWLSKGGSLVKVPGSPLDGDHVQEDRLQAENEIVGKEHHAGLMHLDRYFRRRPIAAQGQLSDEAVSAEVDDPRRRKTIEIVTDFPGSLDKASNNPHSGGARGALGGIMGWEYLIGEMFAADHVTIGARDICLVEDCHGSESYPAGMGSIFFRSGPYRSDHFEHPWMFTAYIPDVLVINLGSTDERSFQDHSNKYNRTLWDASNEFEETYVSLIKGIRRLAYPKAPAVVHNEKSGFADRLPPGSATAIPIFVMRPFRGEFEHATQNVVNKLRTEGDKAVFWLDTSGWLDLGTHEVAGEDFDHDPTSDTGGWRLTEQGNQKVAMFLHAHVCRSLAQDEDECPFLPPEVYQGTVYDAREAHFDRYLEAEKEGKLRAMFWDNDDQHEGKNSPDL